MKKSIFSMMLAMAILAGGSAFAQTNTDGNSGASKQNQTASCCQTQEGKACDQKGNFTGKRKGERPNFNPFDGVQLTEDQQQRLQVLREGIGPVVLDKEQQAKIKENPNLTPEQKKQLKAEKKAKKIEAKKNYLNGVKEILTPEQYVVFLENCYVYSGKDKVYKGGKLHKNKGPKDHKPRGEKKTK